jgi:hypothetical protein
VVAVVELKLAHVPLVLKVRASLPTGDTLGVVTVAVTVEVLVPLAGILDDSS